MTDGNHILAVAGPVVRILRVKDGIATNHRIENAALADSIRKDWAKHEPA